MSLVRDTVRGALWTILTSLGSRAFGLIGTLVVTRFVSPGDYGEVTVATVLVMTANQFSTLGLGQYLVAKPDAPASAAFHANVVHVVLGVLALLLMLAAGPRLGVGLDAPGMIRFLPGLCLAGLFDRLSFVPERLLARDLRFGKIGVLRTLGDLAHTALCIWLVVAGFGAAALVWGNIARSFTRLVLVVAFTGWRSWLAPHRPSCRVLRDILAFGLPISVGSLAGFAARRWDNLLVSRFFGPAVTGMYNLAYNLADVPAIHVGEQIGDVLLPSFARLERQRRPAALARSLGLLALLVFPMAVGLGVIAPTLVDLVFDARWRSVAPMLLVLSLLSITRPVGWVISSYVQALGRPQPLMWLELGKLLVLVVGLGSLGRASPVAACACVGGAYTLHALASLALVRRLDGVPLARSLASLAPAVLACIPLALATLGTRAALAAGGGVPPFMALCLEIAAGAAAYLATAWFVANESARDLLTRLREALSRERRRD